MTTAHLLHLCITHWHNGHHGVHWWLGRAYLRRLAGPHAHRAYITTMLRFLERHHINPRHWRRWNQA